MATRGRDRQTREQRERARTYQARLELHERQGRRRTRDNVIAVVVGAVVIAAAIGVQTVYFVAGPGAPVPTPSSTATPDVSPSVAPETPEPTGTTPAPGTTESPTP